MSVSKIDAFGHIVTEEQNAIGVAGGDGLLAQFGLELDKEIGASRVVKKDPIHMPELIKSYESQCGMEWAKAQLRSGRATQADFYDDGKHGGDFSRSTELNVAYRNSQLAKTNGAKVAESIGGSGDYIKAEDLDAYVKEKIESMVAAQKASANNEGETK